MLCDPRLCDMAIPLFTPDMKAAAVQAFRDEYSLNWAPVASADSTPTPSPDASPENPAPRDGSLGSFMASMEHLLEAPPPSTSTGATAPLDELDEYLREAVPKEQDLLDWWSVNERRFPNVAKMAQQFLAVPASSVSVERLFSLAGRLYGDLRQAMNDGTVTLEERMWAKINTDSNTEI